MEMYIGAQDVAATTPPILIWGENDLRSTQEPDTSEESRDSEYRLWARKPVTLFARTKGHGMLPI